MSSVAYDPDQHKYSEFMRFMRNVHDGEVKIENGQVIAEDFFAAHSIDGTEATGAADWVKDFEEGKQAESKYLSIKIISRISPIKMKFDILMLVEESENYNSQFWSRLQNEWKKISEEDDQAHPWLSEFSEYYDPYKVGKTFIFVLENISRYKFGF